MRKEIIAFAAVLFLFSISFSLDLNSFEANYAYVLSYPELHYKLKASSDVEIYSVELNLSEDLNYVPLYPNKLNADEIGDFEFKLSQIPCGFYGKTIEANLTVNSSDGIQTFNEVFTIWNPLEISASENFAVEVGKTHSVLLELKNNGNSKLNLTSQEEVPNVVYVTYTSPKGYSNEIGNFEMNSFYPIKINFIGSQVGEGTYRVNFTDTRCSNISATYAASIRTYTLSPGIVSYKTMDSAVGILFLILIVILFVKLIKVE